jgi:hypothetical protein
MVIKYLKMLQGTRLSLGSEVNIKMKIKCVKMQCPICNAVGSAQLFLNNKNEIRYTRVRHYKGLNEFKKPQFNYHKVEDLEELKTLLKSQDTSMSNSEAIGQLGQAQPLEKHDPEITDSSLKQQNKRLGSLAWWGTALVRRRSRDQSPPEAPQKNKYPSQLSALKFLHIRV